MEYTIYIRIHRKSHECIEETRISGSRESLLNQLNELCDESITSDEEYMAEREG